MTHQNICTSRVVIKCSYLCATCQMHLSIDHGVEEEFEMRTEQEAPS